MADLSNIRGLESLTNKFRDLAAKASSQNGASVIVGYEGVHYAVIVHEDLEANHAPGKQAKFLEQPARQYKGVLRDIIIKAYQRGATLRQALLLGGLRLQRESQKIVPVDTSNLRNSAFTRIEK